MKIGEAGSWGYVLRRDREKPEPEQTRFTLRPLTTDQFFAVVSQEAENGRGGGMLTRLYFGLAGWENLTDADGREIKYEVGEDKQVKVDLLDLITRAPGGGEALAELSMAIQLRLTWTEAESKNSDSPPSSSPEN